jgi:hypothetical protein
MVSAWNGNNHTSWLTMYIIVVAELLHLAPGAATARVRDAGELGQPRSPVQQVLPVVFEHVAAGQAAGSISVSHLRPDQNH